MARSFVLRHRLVEPAQRGDTWTHDEIAGVLRQYEAAVQDHDAHVQAAFYAPDGIREGPAFGAVTVERRLRSATSTRIRRFPISRSSSKRW